MGGVDAQPMRTITTSLTGQIIAMANVVQFQPVRHWAVVELPTPLVGNCWLSAPGKDPVALIRAAANPKPAAIRSNNYVRVKPLKIRRLLWSRTIHRRHAFSNRIYARSMLRSADPKVVRDTKVSRKHEFCAALR
jgi:hypothetical protein